MATEFNISCNALSKILLHSAKYPHLAISGVVLATSRNFDNPSEIYLTDAVPLFHGQLCLTPMLEVALTQIEKHYKAEGKYIAGYYQANENLRDCVPDFVAMKISEKIAENNSDACLIMVDNRKMTTNLDSVPIIFTQFNSEGKWKVKEKTGVHIETGALDVISEFLEKKVHQNLYDFDNHLDDITCDWTNKDISALVDSYMASNED